MWRVRQSGQTVIEVLVAIGLAAVLLPALATAVVATREGRAQEPERLQATALARQANEAVRSVRERGWANLVTNGTYYPTVVSNAWALAPGTEIIGNFTRSIVVADVQRNSAGALVPSGGTVDSSTKKVTITVAWTQPAAGSVVVENYYQRYLNNAVWSQTTQADFGGGTATNTVVTNAAGGEVQLGLGDPVNDWTSPSVVGSYNTTGNQDALDVFAVGDYAYLCDGAILTILNISDPANPAFVGSFSASSTVRHVYVSGNYAYLSTANNSAELTIVNISNPANPTLAGTENLPDSNDAYVTVVEGSYAYVGRQQDTTNGTGEFYILNISNPANPSVLGNLNLDGAVNNLKVNGNYAYLATTIDTQEMIVVNITNKSSPSIVNNYNAPGTADATDLGIDGNLMYVAMASNTSGPEVYVFSIAAPSSPSFLDTYEVGGTVTGISSVPDVLFLSTAISGSQLVVLDVSNPSNVQLLSQLNLDTSANDVKTKVGNYAYIASASNNQELMVVGPGQIPGGFAASGTFDSASFDAGGSAAYNYLAFSVTEPAGTDVRFQVATNNDNSTWNYVGPDGTAGTYYSAPGAVRLNTTGRYIRYRATLTGPGTSTPVFNDITINYSP